MHRRVLSVYVACLILVITLLVGWVYQAGPVTAYRIVVYNFSGIDDVEVFPKRVLKAASSPFHFAEAGSPNHDLPEVKIGNLPQLPLDQVLEKNGTLAFLVIQNDKILLERYFGTYQKDTPSLSFSVGKSIFSILIGCAISDGYIQSVEQRVTDFVPELRDKGFDAVRISHLLQMTSGIDYVENDNPFGIHPRFYYTNQLEQNVLNLHLNQTPGSRFAYKSGDAILLTLILKRALKGQSITAYTQQRLWDSLGMEYGGSWSIDHEPDGMEKTACCLSATARDYAKFGRLYLNKGKWGNRQIVPESWVAKSTKIEAGANGPWQYQYQWWLVGQNRADFMATGHLGQFIYVNPATGVIIVRLGRVMGSLNKDDWKELFIRLSEHPEMLDASE